MLMLNVPSLADTTFLSVPTPLMVTPPKGLESASSTLPEIFFWAKDEKPEKSKRKSRTLFVIAGFASIYLSFGFKKYFKLKNSAIVYAIVCNTFQLSAKHLSLQKFSL